MKPPKFFQSTIEMKIILVIFITICYLGCKPAASVSGFIDDGEIVLKFVQVNDVYEIAPLNNGKVGGMARVAHIRDSIKKENPNTFLFMAGDFLNPSLVGTLKVDGERVYGRQMIETMNAMDFDLVTFGNHEFDIPEAALQQRLNESNFQWVSANVLQVTEKGNFPFHIQKNDSIAQIPQTFILKAKDVDGTEIKIGFISVTIPSNPQPFVFYQDIYDEPEKAYRLLESSTDAIFGLTHLTLAQDQELVQRLPQIQFIIGGHEHNNMLVMVGNTTIAKADANAKSVYVHTLTFNKKTDSLHLHSQLVEVNDKIASQPSVKKIVDKWSTILENEIKHIIPDPYEIIYKADVPLDGSDSASRSQQTNLGGIITKSMASAFSDVDGALVNGGSIRLDDKLEGDVGSMDIFRVLPFGGSVFKVELKGGLLKQILDFGNERAGTGAYLQRYNISQDEKGSWWVAENPLNETETYKIAFSDYLLKGLDIPFLTPENPGVLNIYIPTENEPAADIRKAIILYLKSIKK